MNFQIRDAISANMTNNSSTDVRSVIDDAIQRGEEHLLPGLGVFFEQLWKRSDEKEKTEITNELSQAFAQAQ
ncbi:MULTISPECIES: small acid-soluble spore protein SspI [unclassified Sporosarcina]|uniref:small acid-soluble spore protein SspI n=1 Tax=unclassified Sporosarcina TaxID=2647733 RepID=UPI000C165123|nr:MULTISPECIES: small acid-soluble spore protein SspI [unclassified Sporosarcina]PIC71296.1 small acid-soluble spore protein SspI [Sporosarcina sp. P16b]PID04021.1 small acid-soluble spore protein SspI [Sporosarcina sp. P2]PID25013.1 small acid-soluble spore protein SspI [Sporosarcina sp. P7]